MNLFQFLTDVKKRGYDRQYASYHATNLLMQEGQLDYSVDVNNSINALILDFIVKLDSEPIDELAFQRLVDGLISEIETNGLERIRIVFILYKEDIKDMYRKYSDGKIGIEQFKASLRKFTESKDDFMKLLDMAKIDQMKED
jgi:hypothetical protein